MDTHNTSMSLYEYNFIFPFERNFSPTAAKQWMEQKWHTSFYFSALYILVIFSLRKLMTNSKPYSLNRPLLIWNIALSIFSITAFLRTMPELMHTLNNHGIYHSVCVSSFLTDDNVSSFWSFLFVLSKLPEFGDTLFIVLRKQPLIFLHWYHHILTLLYSWYAFKEFTSSARWFIVMNSLIHSFMYSYYACRALKVRIPRVISVFITTSQICQMAVGCYVNYKAWQFMVSNKPCAISKANLTWSSLMYFSYLLLFARFFYLSYLDKNSKKQKAT